MSVKIIFPSRLFISSFCMTEGLFRFALPSSYPIDRDNFLLPLVARKAPVAKTNFTRGIRLALG